MSQTADPIETLGRIVGKRMAARFNFIDAATVGNAKDGNATKFLTVLAFDFEETGRRLLVSECGRFFQRQEDGGLYPVPRLEAVRRVLAEIK